MSSSEPVLPVRIPSIEPMLPENKRLRLGEMKDELTRSPWPTKVSPRTVSPMPPLSSPSPPASAVPAPPPLKSGRAVDERTDHATLHSMPLSVVIFGATGDLARKKLFPSLFQLCAQGHLPRQLNIVGYGRSQVELAAFIAKQCVLVPECDARLSKADFCSRICFHAGSYDASSSYQELHALLSALEEAHPSGLPGNRLFFLSVPPTVFGTAAQMISRNVRAPATAGGGDGGFTRLMIEKPFGRDSASFEQLNQLTAAHFSESQLFRVDHYLGKEVRGLGLGLGFGIALPRRPLSGQGGAARHAPHAPHAEPSRPAAASSPPHCAPRPTRRPPRPTRRAPQVLLNIPTLRWANSVFEPLWSREHIETVQITFKEDLGTQARTRHDGPLPEPERTRTLTRTLTEARSRPRAARARILIRAPSPSLSLSLSVGRGGAATLMASASCATSFRTTCCRPG